MGRDVSASHLPRPPLPEVEGDVPGQVRPPPAGSPDEGFPFRGGDHPVDPDGVGSAEGALPQAHGHAVATDIGSNPGAGEAEGSVGHRGVPEPTGEAGVIVGGDTVVGLVEACVVPETEGIRR